MAKILQIATDNLAHQTECRLSKREQFALAAMQGIVASTRQYGSDMRQLVDDAFILADEMLKESLTIRHAATCPVNSPGFVPNVKKGAPSQCTCDFGTRLRAAQGFD
jgi:hypothetical protein